MQRKGRGGLLIRIPFRTIHFRGTFAINRGIPALPVHDSFVIEEQHVDECWETMREAFYHRFEQKIPIDVTDILVRANHILRGPAVGKQGEHWKLMEDAILAGIHDCDPDEGWEHGDPDEDVFPTID